MGLSHINLNGCRIFPFQITRFLLLAWTTNATAQRLNYSQILERSFLSKFQPAVKIENTESWQNLQRIPSSTLVFGDILYLPEDDYDSDVDAGSSDVELELERNNRNSVNEYRSLCEVKIKRLELSDAEYEYQPSHYHEVYCKKHPLLNQANSSNRRFSQMCAHPSFHCVQRSRTLIMVRRRWDSECWESYSRQVASGCECMWPVSTLGDITGHY